MTKNDLFSILSRMLFFVYKKALAKTFISLHVIRYREINDVKTRQENGIKNINNKVNIDMQTEENIKQVKEIEKKHTSEKNASTSK